MARIRDTLLDASVSYQPPPRMKTATQTFVIADCNFPNVFHVGSRRPLAVATTPRARSLHKLESNFEKKSRKAFQEYTRINLAKSSSYLSHCSLLLASRLISEDSSQMSRGAFCENAMSGRVVATSGTSVRMEHLDSLDADVFHATTMTAEDRDTCRLRFAKSPRQLVFRRKRKKI